MTKILKRCTLANNFIRLCNQAARKLPKSTPEEVTAREKALLEATKKCVEVPLETMRNAAAIWPWLQEAATIGNFNCRSDIQVRNAKQSKWCKILAYW